MSSHSDRERSEESSIVAWLEMGDGMAHQLVAILLLILALLVLGVSTYAFVKEWGDVTPKSFPRVGLEYLSELLLGVIILELLSTILTYIQARNLEATIKDFLVVALISSIRKILMVGAQSSLKEAKPDDFRAEAVGTVISIIGILLLIGGLLLLDWRMKAAKREEAGLPSGGGIMGMFKGSTEPKAEE